VNLDTQCGVLINGVRPCRRDFNCKQHSLVSKRRLPGRSQPFDVLFKVMMSSNEDLRLSSLAKNSNSAAGGRGGSNAKQLRSASRPSTRHGNSSASLQRKAASSASASSLVPPCKPFAPASKRAKYATRQQRLISTASGFALNRTRIPLALNPLCEYYAAHFKKKL
jgi:hypothetical protein